MKELQLRVPYRYHWHRSQMREQLILCAIAGILSLFMIGGWLWIFFTSDSLSRWFYGIIAVGFLLLEIGVAIGLWETSYSRGLKITMSEYGFTVKTNRIRSVMYRWDEIQACGVGFFRQEPDYLFVYMSKIPIPEVPFRLSSYRYGVNRLWKKLLRKHKMRFRFQKQYEKIVNLPISWQEYEDFKAILPEHLRLQVEESKMNFFKQFPDTRKQWNEVCHIFRHMSSVHCASCIVSEESLRLIVYYRGTYGTSMTRFVCPWNEFVSVGMDYYIFDSAYYPVLYLSKTKIPPLAYGAEHYQGNDKAWFSVNDFWKAFFKENKQNRENRENADCLRLEVSSSQLEKIKAHLPPHLLHELEESEERVYAECPQIKKA